MSICIRSVSENFTIYKDFLGLYAVDATVSKSLFYAICDVLIRCGLDKKMVRGEIYDGAASMSGHLSRVAKLFKDDVNEAIFMHCYSHRLNLVLQDACKQVRCMNEGRKVVPAVV